MTPIQQSVLFRKIDKANIQYRILFHSKVIAVYLLKPGESTIKNCNIPSLESLIESTEENHFYWCPIVNHQKIPNQPDDSFHRQKLAI